MEWHSKEYRQKALDSLQGHWGLAVGVTLFTDAVSLLLQNTSGNLLIVTDTLSWIVGFLLTVGSSWIYLSFVRGGDAAFSNLFDGFRSFVPVMLTGFVQAVCMLLAVLPGTAVLYAVYGILPYGQQLDTAFLDKHIGGFLLITLLLILLPSLYIGLKMSMTSFILKDHPELRGWPAVKASWRMMKGRTWRLFVLELSFFGWIMLAVITFGIGMLWLLPYMSTATAVFYEVNKPV